MRAAFSGHLQKGVLGSCLGLSPLPRPLSFSGRGMGRGERKARGGWGEERNKTPCFSRRFPTEGASAEEKVSRP